MSDTSNATLEFATGIVWLGRSTPAPDDTEQVRRLLLDLLGISLFGATMPWTKALCTWAETFRGAGNAPVSGTRLRVPAQVAALVNGCAGHAYELDDTHNAALSHPGSVVIPAVFASAAGSKATAAQVFAAIIAGYEAMARVGMASNPDAVITRGFHPTPLFGVFGAAAAVGVLHDFDAEKIACAWGHALSLTGGVMQFSGEAAATAVKRLHAGYGAQHGVLAASMAHVGVSAPLRALDGKYGLLAVYGREADVTKLHIDEKAPLQIHAISMKPYSCCRLFHSLIDALEVASDHFTIPAERIERIRVRGPQIMIHQHMLRRPRSVMAAQYSLPYAVGATLAYGSKRFDVYQERYLDDPAILTIADKVEATRDLEIEAHCPARMGGAVELQFKDGTRHSTRVMDSRGTPARPLSVDQIQSKGQSLVDAAHLEFDMAAARKTIWSATDAQALIDLFTG